MSQYLIAYNNTQGFDSNKIHKVITAIPTITDWWHYLPNLYIVNTPKNAKYIADEIISHFQGLLFLIVRLDMKDYNGVLNKDAWEWIRKKNNQALTFIKIVSKPPANRLPVSLLDSLSPPKLSIKKPTKLEEFLKLKK